MGDQGIAFKLKLEGFDEDDILACTSHTLNSSDTGVEFVS